MKKNLFFIGVVVALFYSCKKENAVQEEPKLAPPQSKSVAITDPNDVNLNVNWQWYDPAVQNVTLYFGQKVNNQPVAGVQTAFPWFTFGNPVNNAEKDYRPELGWTLYLKDFGTPDRPAQTPFFALYNKYTGVLRFFVYNYRVRNQGEASKTYYIGELGFATPSNYNSSLSFFASENEFLTSKTNPNTKQIVVTKKDVSDTWLNFDFEMIFDTKYSEVLLNVYGANQTDLALGTDFSTLTARSSVGASGTSLSGFGTAMEKGFEYTGSAQSLFDAIDKLDKALDGNKSATTTATTAVSSDVIRPNSTIGTIAGAIGVVKGAMGVVKSFFGGKKKTSSITHTSIQYAGIVQTTGQANISNNLYSIQFHQDPKAALAANRYVPLYQRPLGVMHAPTKAELYVNRYEYNNCPYIGKYNATMNLSQYSTRTDWSDNFFIESTSLKVDSVTISLVSNKFVDPTKESFLLGLVNFLGFSGSGGYQNSAYINAIIEESGLTEDSVQTKWKTIDKPYLDKRLRLLNLYYPSYINATPASLYPRPSYTEESFPLFAIGIHYRIIDPNYPDQESRDRIIYKLFRPSSVSVQLTTYDGKCPPFGIWNGEY